jgi:hypothetical protein
VNPFFANSLDVAARNLAAAVPGDLEPVRLPPLPSGGVQGITAETLRAVASLYLDAELDHAGIILIAEALAEHRLEIGLRSVSASRKLEQFSDLARRLPTAQQRRALFARLFGFPAPGATHVNHEFQRLFANVCGALLRYASEYDFQRQPRTTDEAILRQAVTGLLGNLGLAQTGNTVLFGQAISRQLQASIDILNDQGIFDHFLVRNLWEVVRAVLRESTPDLDRLPARGQSGMRLLAWVAERLPRFSETAPGQVLVMPRDPVLIWASQWLEAAGLSAGATRL